jgi:hypothetical protein
MLKTKAHPDTYFTQRQLEHRYHRSGRTIVRMCVDPALGFPQPWRPKAYGPKLWAACEVEAWDAAQRAKRER